MVHENALMGNAYFAGAYAVCHDSAENQRGTFRYRRLGWYRAAYSLYPWCCVGFVGVQGLVPGNPARKTHPGHEPRTETYTALLAD